METIQLSSQRHWNHLPFLRLAGSLKREEGRFQLWIRQSLLLVLLLSHEGRESRPGTGILVDDLEESCLLGISRVPRLDPNGNLLCLTVVKDSGESANSAA